MEYDKLLAEQAELRENGIYRGIGIAGFIKGTAPSPVSYCGAGGARIAAQDATTVKLEPSGGIIVALGVTDQGQGVDTVMEQIAAAAIGCHMDQVRAISGDTDAIPYGGGTYASRATAIGGPPTRRHSTCAAKSCTWREFCYDRPGEPRYRGRQCCGRWIDHCCEYRFPK